MVITGTAFLENPTAWSVEEVEQLRLNCIDILRRKPPFKLTNKNINIVDFDGNNYDYYINLNLYTSTVLFYMQVLDKIDTYLKCQM